MEVYHGKIGIEDSVCGIFCSFIGTLKTIPFVEKKPFGVYFNGLHYLKDIEISIHQRGAFQAAYYRIMCA